MNKSKHDSIVSPASTIIKYSSRIIQEPEIKGINLANPVLINFIITRRERREKDNMTRAYLSWLPLCPYFPFYIKSTVYWPVPLKKKAARLTGALK